jgi:hypothetical protein
MPSLVDIAPVREKVTIRGVDIEVRGIGIDAIAAVLSRFADLRKVFEGATSGQQVDAVSILAQAPAAAHELMAAATGKMGDQAEIAAAADMVADDQLTLFEVVIRLSFPGGLNPFGARLAALFGTAKTPPPNGALDAPSGKEPDTNSPQPSTS